MCVCGGGGVGRGRETGDTSIPRRGADTLTPGAPALRGAALPRQRLAHIPPPAARPARTMPSHRRAAAAAAATATAVSRATASTTAARPAAR